MFIVLHVIAACMSIVMCICVVVCKHVMSQLQTHRHRCWCSHTYTTHLHLPFTDLRQESLCSFMISLAESVGGWRKRRPRARVFLGTQESLAWAELHDADGPISPLRRDPWGPSRAPVVEEEHGDNPPAGFLPFGYWEANLLNRGWAWGSSGNPECSWRPLSQVLPSPSQAEPETLLGAICWASSSLGNL